MYGAMHAEFGDILQYVVGCSHCFMGESTVFATLFYKLFESRDKVYALIPSLQLLDMY